MNRKTLLHSSLIATSLLMATSAQAAWEGNFLLGVEAGYADRNGHVNVDTVEPNGIRAGYTQGYDDNGFIWGVLGGYQVKCNNLLLGLEANLSWQDFGVRQSRTFRDGNGGLTTFTSEHERHTVFGLTARVGYQIVPWMMPYLRAGAETSDEGMILIANDANYNFSIDNDQRAYRFIGGAGVEFPLMSDQASLRLEYNYSSRGKGAEGTVVNPIGGEAVTANIKPNQHAVKLGFVWNFI